MAVILVVAVTVSVYFGTMLQPEVEGIAAIEVQSDKMEVLLDDPVVNITGTLFNVTDPSTYPLYCEKNIDGEVGWEAVETIPALVTTNTTGSFTFQANIGYSGTFVDVRVRCVISNSTFYSNTLRIAILVSPPPE